MIGGAKSMIASCIDRMRQDACGGCERRDACASLFKAFGLATPSKRWGERPVPSATPKNPFLVFLGEIAKTIEAKAAEARMKPPTPSAFQLEVERRLEPMLASGSVRIEQVARELGYSRQTLYRRLKAEGVTFARLLDGLRRRLALRFLREGVSVKEVAYRLGFSDPAAFSRAFKRWTGSSPSEMRE
jgi:AraC-like DNA-binding protein